MSCFQRPNGACIPTSIPSPITLKAQGYATACFGKWHLGHYPETLPRGNGFDTYYGIPYSNDMNHPDNKGKPKIPSDDLGAIRKAPSRSGRHHLSRMKTSSSFRWISERSPGATLTRQWSLSRRTRTNLSFSMCRIRCPTFRCKCPMMSTIQIRKMPTRA